MSLVLCDGRLNDAELVAVRVGHHDKVRIWWVLPWDAPCTQPFETFDLCCLSVRVKVEMQAIKALLGLVCVLKRYVSPAALVVGQHDKGLVAVANDVAERSRPEGHRPVDVRYVDDDRADIRSEEHT